MCTPENVAAARDLISEELELHHYPIQDVETLSESEELVELAATLVPTTAEPEELDRIVGHLERHPEVQTATWSVSAML